MKEFTVDKDSFAKYKKMLVEETLEGYRFLKWGGFNSLGTQGIVFIDPMNKEVIPIEIKADFFNEKEQKEIQNFVVKLLKKKKLV